METTYQTRCMEENTKILEEIVTLRQKQAELLKSQTHAASLGGQDGQGSLTVKQFLNDQGRDVAPLLEGGARRHDEDEGGGGEGVRDLSLTAS